MLERKRQKEKSQRENEEKLFNSRPKLIYLYSSLDILDSCEGFNVHVLMEENKHKNYWRNDYLSFSSACQDYLSSACCELSWPCQQ
jgi:hypothetical protein